MHHSIARRIATAATAALALTGTAVATAVPAGAASYNVIVQPDQGITPIYNLINSATSSLDLTVYELVDTTAEQDLAALESSGVTVRVILDSRKKTTNQAACTYLAGKGVGVAWSSSTYYYTHEKSFVIDGTELVVMSGNLTSQYYSADRNYSVTDTADAAAFETVSNADYTGATVTPSDADHLVWSPTDAQSRLLALINGATSSLYIEAQEMGYATVVNALVAAANRGVAVKVVMTNSSDTYTTQFDTLTAAGVQVSTYADTDALYIHAKAIVADYGTSAMKVYVGSQNFSSTSLNSNRELGIILTSTVVANKVEPVIASDFTGGTVWS
ncbi:phospholipase D-like domain-containing protein [Actinacidiphila oryziradicis]|uniref:phospholipase D-like domain-containing protein n=1 Tax=Actinacidiphila oryziradicis TaxID=2571141 RepID=UPI0023F0354B|nr:phospholipase D-like domain-containing protein [Actinacidiphila oryziradicis]MCW2872673.1 phosphatidylserine/phosphatidylglycerophosphate/cardiolipin synthase-like protein [Actinacidiphila oryziradicis]